MKYTLTRSHRKTVAIQIKRDGEIYVKAPFFVPIAQLEKFLSEKSDWISKKQSEQIQRKRIIYTDTEIKEQKQRLKTYLDEQVYVLWKKHILPPYTSIKITKSEGRWGSCSAKNGLCFSYRLSEFLTTKKEFIDAVIIHELAHLREKNHKKSFWDLVYSMMPEYEKIMKDTSQKDHF